MKRAVRPRIESLENKSLLSTAVLPTGINPGGPMIPAPSDINPGGPMIPAPSDGSGVSGALSLAMSVNPGGPMIPASSNGSAGATQVVRTANASPSDTTTPAPAANGLVVTLTTNRSVYREGQAVRMTLKETNTTDHSITVEMGPSIDGFFITQNGNTVWRSNAGAQPQFVVLKTIPAHRSIELRATWNGESNASPLSSPTGTFVVHSQVPNSPTATIKIKAG